MMRTASRSDRRSGAPASSGQPRASGPLASSSRKSSSRSSANGIAAGRSAVELASAEQLPLAGALGRLRPEAVAEGGDDRGGARVGAVLAGHRELQPRHVVRQPARGPPRPRPRPDGSGDRGPHLLGRVVEAADHERRGELEPRAERRGHAARVAIRVDDQARQVGRQEDEVVERRPSGWKCAWFDDASAGGVKTARCFGASAGRVRAMTKMSSRVRTL